MSNKNTHSASDTLAASDAKIEADIAHYPPEVKKHVIWLAGFIRKECNCSLKLFMHVVQSAGVSGAANTWYQILGGKYFRVGGNSENWIQRIKEIREFHNRGSVKGRIPFVETSVWKEVEDFIDALRSPDNVCRMGVIAADTGTSKTACLSEYQRRNNHGATVRFEAPSTPRLNKLLFKWLRCYTNRSSFASNIYAENELRNQLNSTKCVIIENAQRMYQSTKGANQELFSFIQEIQEDTGCTIILCWTRGFTKTFLHGGKNAASNDSERAFFEQFVGRIGGEDQILSLPEKCRLGDLRKIAKTLHVEDVEGALPILKTWAKADGKIRILFSKIQKAKRLAESEDSEVISLEHLQIIADEAASPDA